VYLNKKMNYPKVSIIILNWNGLEDTIECLESLKKIAYPNYEVIVVDNGSEGNDAQVLEEKFGNYIHLIKNDRNYGYTGGNNIGIRYALSNSDPDYLLMLNNDIIVAPDFLNHLVAAAAADASIGIVGPKVYYYGFPRHLQTAGARVNMWTGQAPAIGSRQIDAGQYDRQREVDYVFGCCLLAKKEVIQKVGLFDESYFCYYDEIDYCTRAGKAHYKVCYIPEAKIWHKNPMKEKVWDKTPERRRKTDFSYYYMARNNFRFMRKHATRWQYSSFLVCFFGCYFWFATGICLLYHRDIGRLTGFYRGVRDGLLDRNGAKI
jgi:GT2 family glycosyltransferase